MSRLFARLAFSATVCFAAQANLAQAEPVTAGRIASLPEAERGAWTAYLERSAANVKADAAAIDAELAAHNMTVALKAPDGGDFKLSNKPGDPWFAGDEAAQLAAAILSYQTATGGWSKHTGYSRGPRQPGMQWTSQNEPGKPPHYVATFDNGSTTEQMHLLAGVWQTTKRDDCRAAFQKGVKFILAAQYPTGGWPQVYPIEGGYHDDITLNDDAQAHILELLYAIETQEPYSSLVDDDLRKQAADAFTAGLRCVAQMQIAQGDKKTGWCAQHDAITLKPAAARAMEPASISGAESAQLVKFLMTINNPSPELVQTIESALAWLDSAKVAGLTKTKIDNKTAYVADPASTELYWARFYDLADSHPLFPGRDGVIYATFNEMAANNKLGYDYLSTLPGSIVTNGQKKWRKMLEKQNDN